VSIYLTIYTYASPMPVLCQICPPMQRHQRRNPARRLRKCSKSPPYAAPRPTPRNQTHQSRIPHTRLVPLPRRPMRRRRRGCVLIPSPAPIAINTRALPAPVLLLLRPGRTHHRRGHRLLPSPRFRRATTATETAAEDGEEQKAADAGADADDQVAVVVDPGGDLAPGGGAFALSL